MNTLLNLIDKLSVNVGKTFAWLSIPMILVIVYEVVARKIFNNPTDWAHESTTMLYGTFCIVGAIWTLHDKGHVRTEVIHQIMPLKVQHFFDIITGFLGLAMLIILFIGSYEFAADSWAKHEISSKSTWGVVVYPFKSVIPFATALMILQQLVHIVRDLMKFFKRHDKLADLSIED